MEFACTLIHGSSPDFVNSRVSGIRSNYVGISRCVSCKIVKQSAKMNNSASKSLFTSEFDDFLWVSRLRKSMVCGLSEEDKNESEEEVVKENKNAFLRSLEGYQNCKINCEADLIWLQKAKEDLQQVAIDLAEYSAQPENKDILRSLDWAARVVQENLQYVISLEINVAKQLDEAKCAMQCAEKLLYSSQVDTADSVDQYHESSEPSMDDSKEDEKDLVTKSVSLDSPSDSIDLESDPFVDDNASDSFQEDEKDLVTESVSLDSPSDSIDQESEPSVDDNDPDSVQEDEKDLVTESASLDSPSDIMDGATFSDDSTDKETGKLDMEDRRDDDVEREKATNTARSNKVETQKEVVHDNSPSSTPKASLKKLFGFEFKPASVFHGLMDSANRQMPKLIDKFLLLGAGMMGRGLELPVYFGDVGSHEVLHKVGAERASAAAINLDSPGANYRTVWALNKYFPNVKAFVRAHDVIDGLNLQKAGASVV